MQVEEKDASSGKVENKIKRLAAWSADTAEALNWNFIPACISQDLLMLSFILFWRRSMLIYDYHFLYRIT